MKEIRGDDFYEEVINPSYGQLVLVEFWAPWCGPCKGLMQMMEAIEQSRQFPILFKKLDIDRYTDIALDHKVMGVPHTKIFASGQPIASFSDSMSKPDIELWIKSAMVLPSILRFSHFRDWDVPVSEYIDDLQNNGRPVIFQDWISLVLAKYFLIHDTSKGIQFLEEISDESEYFEDKLLLRDLYKLTETEFESHPFYRKMWAAKNSLLKMNFESTYQFLLQAARIQDPVNEDAKLALVAFHQYLGSHHELNRKYQSQYDQIIS